MDYKEPETSNGKMDKDDAAIISALYYVLATLMKSYEHGKHLYKSSTESCKYI